MTEINKNLILFLGADWWGSDARSLAAAFRRSGHSLIEVINEDYLPSKWSSFSLKVLRRLAKPLFIENFNQAVIAFVGNPAIDFILVFKGNLLRAATLDKFKTCGTPIYCFYPDVSFLDHGPEIPKCLPHYDCLFTTKTYHLQDTTLQSRIKQMRIVSHGYDPEVHRRVVISNRMQSYYGCDVSFVGCWSPKKESLINVVVRDCPDLKICIWGVHWGRARGSVKAKWQGREAFGDELAIIYGASKVNLGLLSEAGGGTSVGDSVTARTWQIPAAGGFLLHEDTPEVAQFFHPDTEIGVFKSAAELPAKLFHYVRNEQERTRILEAGYRRCLDSGYTHDATVAKILEFHHQAC